MEICLNDTRIIDFFKNSNIDPEEFIITMIPVYKLVSNNLNGETTETSIIKCIQEQPQIISNIVLAKFSDMYKFYNDQITSIVSIVNNKDTSQIQKIEDYLSNTKYEMEKIKTSFEEFNNKFKVSSLKGKFTEDLFYKELLCIFPDCQVDITRSQSSRGDFLIQSENKPDIIIDIKNYSRNVDKEEIEKFKRDCSLNNSCGILLSTNGICNKKNFAIDIDERRVLVYIHNFDYTRDKVTTATNIIYYLHDVLTDIEMPTLKSISHSDLERIKEEYTLFVLNKESSLNNLKEFYIKQLKYYNEMDINFLRNMFLNNLEINKPITLKCQNCSIYKTDNKKSLSNHTRKCIKSYQKIEV